MSRLGNILLPAICIVLLAGCSVRENVEDAITPVQQDKIVGIASKAIQGSILVKLGDFDNATRLLEFVSEIGAEAERVFTPLPGKEDVEREKGLDLWWQLSFDPSISAQQVADALARQDWTVAVQYDRHLYNEVEKATPLLDAPTKTDMAGDMTDPYFSRQWNLYNNGSKTYFGERAVAGVDVNVKDAWRLSAGDPSIIVAIVDDGVKYTHPDLAANMWVNQAELNGKEGVDDDGNGFVDDIHGYNFAGDGAINWARAGTEGHGTHVAGLVAAVNNNGTGISSIAGGSGIGDGVRLMSCQIFEGGKDKGIASYARAIRYAADNGASVLQCSWGGNSGDFLNDGQYERGHRIELDALEYFLNPGDPSKYNSGVITDGNIVIFSAGNDHGAIASYPGAYRKFICVSAISQDGLPAWYTNYGAGCNIAAPGGDTNIGPAILSTLPSEVASANGMDYGYMQGTSQATPQVSAIAALGLSYAKKLGRKFTRDEFKAMLLTSVRDIYSGFSGNKTSGNHTLYLDSYKGKMGTGAVDAWNFLMQIEGTPTITVKSGEDVSIDLSPWFGGGASSMTFTAVTIASADAQSLGVEGTPQVSGGTLKLRCSKNGCGKIVIKAIAGGSEVGGESAPGGMEISKTVSIVSRPFVTRGSGWL